MKNQSLTTLAQKEVSAVITKGDSVIDATAGNGHDTCFLAECVGATGRVYSFDIQKNALEGTEKALRANNNSAQVNLIHDSHANINHHVDRKITAAMFNFGYLPGSDKSIITKPQSTLYAIEQCIQLLKINGLITLLCYRGHEGGLNETTKILIFLNNLDKNSFTITRYETPGPLLILISKP